MTIYRRFDRSRLVTDVAPEPVVFRRLFVPVISPPWWKNRMWVASGRGWVGPKYDTDIREILAENSMKEPL